MTAFLFLFFFSREMLSQSFYWIRFSGHFDVLTFYFFIDSTIYSNVFIKNNLKNTKM